MTENTLLFGLVPVTNHQGNLINYVGQLFFNTRTDGNTQVCKVKMALSTEIHDLDPDKEYKFHITSDLLKTGNPIIGVPQTWFFTQLCYPVFAGGNLRSFWSSGSSQASCTSGIHVKAIAKEAYTIASNLSGNGQLGNAVGAVQIAWLYAMARLLCRVHSHWLYNQAGGFLENWIRKRELQLRANNFLPAPIPQLPYYMFIN
jgi:hypothetical protein